MAVTLGNYTFDDAFTTVSEKLEEVGGRNERSITIKGMVVGKENTQEIHDELDTILAAASTEDYSTELVIRTDRRMLVRRDGFIRDVHGDALTGAFSLHLDALYPHEESLGTLTDEWEVLNSGATHVIDPGGNAETETVITLVPTTDMVNPKLGDGVRTIAYLGTIVAGQSLVFDGVNKTITLDGVDVIASTTGTFPRLTPGGTTLLFVCSPTEGEFATVTTEFRSRWF